ncbi:hypothetical protein GMES_0203 [Paraglaciecola mesophila KMM 241]|uniref:Uncharacterized protein n=1 Tax=Paraglaciecola mesophila KMM 241 TaxID=1128912 RepID=K6Z0J0_9ALTE|nr:hypothetical protein [Paraglaciecola mesophila]GAC22513.1 hypothetical protein GMES_0203 [Paraglaciecola mesophila KMM 241]
MSSSSYPSWVPVFVSNYIEMYITEWANHPKQDCVRVIRSRFINFNDYNACSFWEEFAVINNIELVDFIRVLMRAVSAKPNKMESMTPTQRKVHRDKIRKTARLLGELISDTVYESVLDRESLSLAGKIVKTVNNVDNVELPESTKGSIYLDCNSQMEISQVLKAIQYEDEYTINPWLEDFPVAINKPNDKNASRAYFAQVLVNYFGNKTGNPQRKAVRLLCLVFYPELQELSDSDFRRIAPWPPKKIDI